jgi:NTP pyrophosphatase (non-canonical NTP hydrolase)
MSKDLSELMHRVTAFAAEREWQAFHDPKNLAMAIASEAGELCSTLRWISTAEADVAASAPPRREAIWHEMADIAILLLLLCNRLNVELDEIVLQKLALNEARYPVSSSRGRADRPPGGGQG